MAITLNATAEPNNVPPRVRLDLDTGAAGTVFDTIEVRRDGVLIRSQPPVGSQVSVAYDYEAPFGVVSTYTLEGGTTSRTTLRTETWPNLTGWATDSGTPSVSGGTLSGAGTVSRTIAGTFSAAGKLTVTDFYDLVFSNAGSLRVGGIQIGVHYSGLFFEQKVYVTALDPSGAVLGSVTFDRTTGPYTVVWGNGVVRLTDGLGHVASMAASPAFATIPVVATSKLSGFVLEAFSASPTPIAVLTDTVTLDSDFAWLIHPAYPDLSVNIGDAVQSAGLYVVSTSADNISRVRQADVFAPIGRARQVVVTNGNRREGDWSLVLCAPAIADRDSVIALVRDQTPLLLRVPPDFGWDLADDYYSVGDVVDDRTLDRRNDIWRTLTLPLTPVDPPVVAQFAEWTYADTLSTYPTYSDAKLGFPTYLDRLVGLPT